MGDYYSSVFKLLGDGASDVVCCPLQWRGSRVVLSALGCGITGDGGGLHLPQDLP